MSKWKPISDLVAGHQGYVWLRHEECISQGFKSDTGGFRYCHTEINLGSFPTHWIPAVDFINAVPVPVVDRPTFHATREKRSKWVRVEDRKPETADLLTYSADGCIRDSRYEKSTDRFYMVGTTPLYYFTPTHWRPLPKGPKE